MNIATKRHRASVMNLISREDAPSVVVGVVFGAGFGVESFGEGVSVGDGVGGVGGAPVGD